MTRGQTAIAMIGLLVVAAALAGLFVRRRYSGWWTLTLYLASILVLGLLPHVAPAIWTPDFYQGKETAYTVLRFAMALEIGLRIFRSFPGAMASARRLVLVVLALTLGAILIVPREGYETFVGDLQPRILNGTIWLFSGLAALILWYRLPLKPFYKAIVLSYVPYLLVSTVLTTALVKRGWSNVSNLQMFTQLAYVALVAWWNVVIWRRDPPLRADPQPAAPHALA